MDQSDHAWGQMGVSDRMRDLLARASQDQAYDQRSQDAAIDEIRQRLEGLEWLTRELRERELGGLVGQLEAVDGRLTSLTDKAPGWAETLAEHIAKVGDRVEPMTELPSGVEAMSNRVDDAIGRLQSLTDSTQQSLAQVESLAERMEQLQASMENAAMRFSRLDKALGELSLRSDRLEAQVNTIGELMTGGLADLSARTEQQLGEVTDNVRSTVSDAMNGSIPEHLGGLRESVEEKLESFGGTVHTGMESVGGRVEQLTGRIESLDGRLEGIDGRLEGIDGRVDGVDGRIEGVQGRLDGVEGQIDGVTGRFEKIDGQFEKVDGHFEAVDGHFEAVGGRFDTVTGQFEAVHGQFEAVGGRFDTVTGQFEAINGQFESLGGRVDGQFESLGGRVDGQIEGLEGKVDGQFEGLGGKFERIDGHFEAVAGRFDNVEGNFEDLDAKVDSVDDRLEAVNQRVGQLPATLDIAELRGRLTELAERPVIDHSDRLDALHETIGQNVQPISDAVHARPDRDEVKDTLSSIVESSQGSVTERINSLEETVLTLAEALLRPGREDAPNGGSVRKSTGKGKGN